MDVEGLENYLLLSKEELAYLLKVLKKDNFPGIEQNLLTGMTNEQQIAALLTAENALISRGFIQLVPEEKKVKIDPVILAFIAIPLVSKYSLTLFISKSNNPIHRFAYFMHSNIIVEMDYLDSRVFLFSSHDNAENVINRIMKNMALNSIAAKNYYFALDNSTFQKIVEIIQSQYLSSAGQKNSVSQSEIIRDAIISMLSQQKDLDEKIIFSFASTLSNTSLFCLIIYNKENIEPQAFYIIEGEGFLWHIEQNIKDETFSILSSSPDHFNAFLQNIFATFHH